MLVGWTRVAFPAPGQGFVAASGGNLGCVSLAVPSCL